MHILILPPATRLAYGEGVALETIVEEAAEIINQRLMHVMMGKFRLQQHCYAIKQYILLGARRRLLLTFASLSVLLRVACSRSPPLLL
jgi:hypothetical protein